MVLFVFILQQYMPVGPSHRSIMIFVLISGNWLENMVIPPGGEGACHGITGILVNPALNTTHTVLLMSILLNDDNNDVD